MAAGETITGSLADSLESVVAGSRARREYGNVMTRIVDRQTLDNNTGLKWRETVVEKMDAQDITEQSDLDMNPQQYVDDILEIEPTMIGISTFVTDKAKRTISTETLAQMGSQLQNAIERTKDVDGLTLLDSLTALGGAGTTITAGHIRAGAARNRVGGTSEPWDGPQATVLHSYQVKVLEDEIEAGLGTYPIPNGLSENVYRDGLKGMVSNTQLFVDDNMTIDSAGDAKGAVFASGNGGAIVLVNGMIQSPRTKEAPNKGGGGEWVYHYDEFKYGLRQSNWGKEMYFDAPTPSS